MYVFYVFIDCVDTSSSSLMSSAVPVSNLEILAALSRKELLSLMQKQDVSLGLQSQEKRMNIWALLVYINKTQYYNID